MHRKSDASGVGCIEVGCIEVGCIRPRRRRGRADLPRGQCLAGPVAARRPIFGPTRIGSRVRAVARLALAVAFASATIVLPLRAGAQSLKAGEKLDGPFRVVGDEIEYQADRDAYVARGHVVITQEGRRLTADRVLFSDRTGIGIATGNVVITEGDDTLTSDLVQFNTENMQGVVFEGRLESSSSLFVMEGKELRKTGEKTYEFEEGRFTTCQCPEPDQKEPWHLTAKRAELELEGYARARNATFDVLGVPVFWLPYVIYPLRTDRQTGFLFPEIGFSSRNSFEFGLPFFWAARQNVNVTVTPEYLSKRGFKPNAEVEYLFAERGAGMLYGTWISDQEIEQSDPGTPFDKNRWGASVQHVMDLPLRSWFAADATLLSDNEMPFDFDDFNDYRSDRFLHSRALAATRFGSGDVFGFESALLGSDDLQNPDDLDRDNLLLQRLPELTLSATPTAVPFVPGLVASGELEFVNFQRLGDPNQDIRALLVDDRFFDTGADAVPNGRERDSAGNDFPPGVDGHRDDGQSEGNGVFDEGEPLADRGQRVVVHPRLAYPMRFADLVEVNPEIGWYGTFYQTDRVGSDARNLFTGRLDLRSRARGDVQLPFAMGAASHLVEPHVSWIVVRGDDGQSNPLLVPNTAVPQDRLRQLAVDNQLLDPSDRIEELNSLVFGVRNRFLRGRVGTLIADLDLSSEYRFEQDEFGPAVLQGEARLPRGLWMRFLSSVDVEAFEFAEGMALVGWAHPFGHQASLRYRYIRDIPRFFEAFRADADRFDEFSDGFLRVNQIGGFARVQLTKQWAATFAGNFSFENALSLSNQFGVEYLSRCKCWAIRLEVDNDRVRGASFGFNYRILGLGDDREQPFQGRTGRRFGDLQGL